MNTEAILTLISDLSEQLQTLKKQLSDAKEDANRYREWWYKELEKNKETVVSEN